MTIVDLVNMAFAHIGVTKGITAITDNTPQAYLGELFYDHKLRAALRKWPWPFATKYADLSLVQGSPIASSDSLVQAWSSTATYAIGDVVQVASVNYFATAASLNQTPPNASYWETEEDHTDADANGDWRYAYRWPSDCLFARRIVPPGGNGRVYSTEPIPFRVGRDVNGLVIYCNEQDANLEYTMIGCGALWADDLFLEWFTWEMAKVFAPAHAKTKEHMALAWEMAERTFTAAAVVAAREHEPQRMGDAEWIAGR